MSSILFPFIRFCILCILNPWAFFESYFIFCCKISESGGRKNPALSILDQRSFFYSNLFSFILFRLTVNGVGAKSYELIVIVFQHHRGDPGREVSGAQRRTQQSASKQHAPPLTFHQAAPRLDRGTTRGGKQRWGARGERRGGMVTIPISGAGEKSRAFTQRLPSNQPPPAQRGEKAAQNGFAPFIRPSMTLA